MRWGIQASNAFFRLVYCGRLWLSRAEGQALVQHGWNMLESLLQQMLCLSFPIKPKIWEIMGGWTKEAYQGCARLSHSRKWALWYIRPKCHNMAHVVCHARIGILTAMTYVQVIQCSFFYIIYACPFFTTKKRRGIPATGGCPVHLQSSKPGPQENRYHWSPKIWHKVFRPRLGNMDRWRLHWQGSQGRSEGSQSKSPNVHYQAMLDSLQTRMEKVKPPALSARAGHFKHLGEEEKCVWAHDVCPVHTQASSVVHRGIQTHTYFWGIPNEHISPKRAQIWTCKKMYYNGRPRYIYL